MLAPASEGVMKSLTRIHNRASVPNAHPCYPIIFLIVVMFGVSIGLMPNRSRPTIRISTAFDARERGSGRSYVARRSIHPQMVGYARRLMQIEP